MPATSKKKAARGSRRTSVIDSLIALERAGEDGVPFCAPAAIADEVEALAKSASGRPGVADQRRFDELKPFVEETGRETVTLPPTGRAKKGKDVELIRYKLNERGKARLADERKKADAEREKAVAARRAKLAKALKTADDLHDVLKTHGGTIAAIGADLDSARDALAEVEAAIEAAGERASKDVAAQRDALEHHLDTAFARLRDEFAKEVAALGTSPDAALARKLDSVRSSVDALTDRVEAIADESRAVGDAVQDRLDPLTDALKSALDDAHTASAPRDTTRDTDGKGTGANTAPSESFAKAYDAFRARCRDLSRAFADDKSVRAKVEDEAKAFASRVSGATERVAAELAGVVEVGALRHADDGQIWRQHGLGAFSTKDAAIRILDAHKLNAGELQTVGRLLKLGLGERTQDGLKQEIVLEIDKRALYR